MRVVAVAAAGARVKHRVGDKCEADKCNSKCLALVKAAAPGLTHPRHWAPVLTAKVKVKFLNLGFFAPGVSFLVNSVSLDSASSQILRKQVLTRITVKILRNPNREIISSVGCDPESAIVYLSQVQFSDQLRAIGAV